MIMAEGLQLFRDLVGESDSDADDSFEGFGDESSHGSITQPRNRPAGLELFYEIVGESSDEEEFPGFDHEPIRTYKTSLMILLMIQVLII